MLLYNGLRDETGALNSEEIPADWLVTADRRYFQQADAVVFHLPALYREIQHEAHDMEKQDGQLWVAWHIEPQKKHAWIKNPAIREIFDLWMTFRQDADVVYPCYRYEYPELFLQQVSAGRKQNKSCMYLSEKTFYPDRGRTLYLNELMKHTVIDRYASGNCPSGTEPDSYRRYKFVIAFEDALERDYVTDKFFDPLLAGSVPVYLGAPDMDEFAPGDNCFVDVRQFESPRMLAGFINSCYGDEQLYAGFFAWKNRPLRQSFLRKAEMQQVHPFVRLCRKIDEKRLCQGRQSIEI